MSESSAVLPLLGSTAASRFRVVAFILVFQRWSESEGLHKAIPPGFLESLKRLVLEPEIRLDFDRTFHLAVPRKVPGSSSVTRVIEFSVAGQEDTGESAAADVADKEERGRSCGVVSVRFVRKFSNDLHTLDIRTGEVDSLVGHHMCGSSKESSSFGDELPSPPPKDAFEIVREQWVAPRRWLREGRAVVVRPGGVLAAGVTLCEEAREALSRGFTLLLVVGDLIRVNLPGAGRPVLFAGMMWKEGKAQTFESTEEGQGEGRQAGVVPLQAAMMQPAQKQLPPVACSSAKDGGQEKDDRSGEVSARSHVTRKSDKALLTRKRRYYEEKKKKRWLLPPRKRPDELAFVIAEVASHRGFSGRQCDDDEDEVYERDGGWFANGMYVWQPHDVYSYFHGFCGVK